MKNDINNKTIVSNCIFFIQCTQYNINEVVAANNVSRSNITVANTISGTVNVNSSIYITGTNTKFNVVNNKVITIGSTIAVNSEIRYINAIYSNGTMTVNSAFTITSNDETLVIVT